LLLRTPKKKNWDSSRASSRTWDSSRASSRTCDSSRASSRASRSEKKKVSGSVRPSQAILSGTVQEEIDLWEPRMRQVLQEVQGIQANVPVNSSNVPVKSSFEDEDQTNQPRYQRGKALLKDWCIEKGFKLHRSTNNECKQKHKHHIHSPPKDEKEHNGPRRSSSKDPPPRREHNRDYGQSQDAIKIWKSCQPKQPRKGDLEVLPAYAAPRQLYLE